MFSNIIALSLLVTASEPTLTIRNGKDEKTFTRAALLKHPKLETIQVSKDPAYPKKEMTYKAIKTTALFEGSKLNADDVLQFECLDGFKSLLPKDKVLNSDPKKSISYIAIEDPANPWPHVLFKKEKPTAGPFYLVWVNPELSGVTIPDWPYGLKEFFLKPKDANEDKKK